MPCTMPYWKAVAVAHDQLVNAWLRGWPDETLSSRCWRWYSDGRRRWPKIVVDAIFCWDKNHCEESYKSERLGRQLPPELRPPIAQKNKSE